MKRRYSIWGREYGADFDVELIQVDNNPQAVIAGYEKKTLMIKFGTAKRRSRTPLYSNLRFVENGDA